MIMQLDYEVVWEFLEFFGKEIACKGSGHIRIDPRMVLPTLALRKDCAHAMEFTSFCRSPSHNKKVGGHPHSLHLTVNPKWNTLGCMAGDVNWLGWSDEKKLQFALKARKHGFRVGLNDSFIHIDRGHDIGITKGVFVYSNYTGALFSKLK